MLSSKAACVMTITATLALAATASASAPRTWMLAGAHDFAAGDPVGVTIDAHGDILLGPQLDLVVETTEPRVWALAAAPDGTVYVAAGEQGRVVRVRPGQEAEPLFVAEQLGVQALAWGPDGALYVAAGPDGGIYRVPADHDGTALEPWFVPDAKYVWDLAFDAAGNLLVATGGDGTVVRVDREGGGEIVYRSSEPHVTALAFDDAGNLFAGTDGSGLIYRIDPAGGVFVLYESPLREITDLIVKDDAVWAAAFGTAGTAGEGGTAAPGESPRASRNGGAATASKGAVFRVDPDGYAREIWSSEEHGAYSLAPYDGAVVVGTGNDGRLLRLDPGEGTALLARADAEQIVALRSLPGGELLIAASNAGKVQRLAPGYRERGEYLSPVHDTGTISRWGTLRWFATVPDSTSVRIATRSGNRAEPDETWSPWSEADSTGAGIAVTSPPGRFVQWRAVLATGDRRRSPRLHRVELAFVTRNLPPVVERITVHPAGVVYRPTSGFEDGLPFTQLPASVARELREADPAAAGAGSARAFLGRAFFIAGLQTFTWEATDPNDDELSFRLEFRGEAESSWQPLAGPMSERIFVLDTRRLPDGRYVVRLRASDEPSIPAGDALGDDATSRVFLVDNSPPVLEGLEARTEGTSVTVAGTAADATSLIQGLRYSLDGSPWRAVVPADGVADSPREHIAIHVDALSAGEHVLVVRATDTALNEGAGKVVFSIR